MGEPNPYRRISLDIDEGLYQDLSQYVDRGMRKAVFEAVVKMAVEIAKRRGKIALAFLLDDKFEIKLKEGVADEFRRSE